MSKKTIHIIIGPALFLLSTFGLPGIGTFDEFFEILTLRSLGRHNKPILILNTLGYYDSLISMIECGKKEGFITKDLDFLFVSQSVSELVNHL